MKFGMLFACVVTTSACVDAEEPEYAEALGESTGRHGHLAGELPSTNRTGIATSFSTAGPIDTSGANPFFNTTLGTNGRSCASCHDPRSGWTISAELAEDLFKDSDGLAPLFSLHDSGTRPDADISTKKKRKKVFEPMTDAGLVRFPQGPTAATAEFEVIAVDDPHGYGTPAAFTRFRRPNPTSNEAFVMSLTWIAGPNPPVPVLATVLFPIAVFFHGQGGPVPAEVTQAGAAFQLSVFHAQAYDEDAGRLDEDGARGGPVHLSQQPFFAGINSGASFNPKVFDIYDAWIDSDDSHRRAIARGQAVFNTKTFGPNHGTCGGCHNTPNVGSSSTFRMLRVGTDQPVESIRELVPVLTIRNKTTGEVKQVTDLGRAQSTGLWADVGRFKVQHLRGLAARAPYFHDGRAAKIKDVIEHYEAFFAIDFTGSEKNDLEAFLLAL
jgi:cytochrome c peroxidase